MSAMAAITPFGGFDMNVEAGEIVTVLGANGAGKSSLLKAIQGTVRASAGTVRFDGMDITSLGAPSRVRRGLVLVPEGRQHLRQPDSARKPADGRLYPPGGMWSK